LKLHSGRFDVPDRIFHSIADTYATPLTLKPSDSPTERGSQMGERVRRLVQPR
jgi:hypothetical protein